MAAADYAFPWVDLIARFKFRNGSAWAEPLARTMWERAAATGLTSPRTIWVAIPVSRERLVERGYNQAWELCRVLSRRSGHPAKSEALVRLGSAPDQHRLPLAQRLTNLRGQFAVHPERATEFCGAHVVLVDDVRTTGATLESAAHTLVQAGCARVDALVFARTSFDLGQTNRI